MTQAPALAENLQRLRERIAAACARSARDVAGVRLIAVSKFHPVNAMLAAADLGVVDFGENRVQEALEKLPGLRAGMRLHLIGTLQTNKVNKAVGNFASIQSVDRPELLHRLSDRAAALGIVQEILLQVNLTHEAQKGGMGVEQLAAQWELARSLPSLRPTGLMTLGRAGASESETRHDFAALRHFAARLPGANELSMGMSDDFEWAIEEGATQIRVGTILFGPRVAVS